MSELDDDGYKIHDGVCHARSAVPSPSPPSATTASINISTPALSNRMRPGIGPLRVPFHEHAVPEGVGQRVREAAPGRRMIR
jgi:hypothetical protein